MHDMVSGAPQDERRRSCSERGGAKGKCQGALKPQSPRRLPGFNHLRSSLTSGIDRHARYDLVPAPPPPTPPHLFELQRIFYFLFSVEQLGSFDIEQIFSPLSLSHTHTANIFPHTQHRLSFCFGCVCGCASSEPG